MTQTRRFHLFATAALLVAVVAAAGCTDSSNATTRLEIRFAGHSTDIAVDVASDLHGRPTAAQYERDGIPHPDAYTVHDQLEEWSRQAGKAYAAASYLDSGFGAGYFLTAIDGVEADGATAYWSLSINGEASTVGMSQAVVAAGDTVTWTFTPTSSEGDLVVTLQAPEPTVEDSITIHGKVSRPATIMVWGTDGEGGDAIYTSGRVDADGAWNVTLPGLVHGRTAVEAFADDGVTQGFATVVVIRLASATFEALYTASPDHAATSDLVWYDPDALASAPLYEGTGTEHPGYAIVHDFMVAWTAQTGTPIEYGGPGAFGFSVNRIDGVGQPLDSALPPYWCYTLNGESAELGISLQAVRPGDVVTWEYGACA